MKTKNSATVLKAFNNNIVHVRSKGKEKILYEKGIGFGKKFGEIIKTVSLDFHSKFYSINSHGLIELRTPNEDIVKLFDSDLNEVNQWQIPKGVQMVTALRNDMALVKHTTFGGGFRRRLL